MVIIYETYVYADNIYVHEGFVKLQKKIINVIFFPVFKVYVSQENRAHIFRDIRLFCVLLCERLCCLCCLIVFNCVVLLFSSKRLQQ